MIREEALRILFDIAASDWAWYYQEMLPTFLQQAIKVERDGLVSELLKTMANATDWPSFAANATALISDFRVLTGIARKPNNNSEDQ